MTDAVPPVLIAGRYAVEAVLGQGGMGVVYRARDIRLNRPVAVKTIRANFLGDALASARFFREAQVLARLNHPNILTVHDFGQEGDTHYLVMELGGPDLDTVLEWAAGPLPLEQVHHIALGVG